MKNDKIILLHRIFGIVLSISILLAGICLIWGCLSIYNSGDKPYSREAVASTFSVIAIPVFISLALTVVGFILQLTVPVDSKKKIQTPSHMTLERLCDVKDTENCDSETAYIIKKERNGRKMRATISMILMLLACIAAIPCAINYLYFHPEDINKSVATTFASLAAYMLIPFGYAIFASYRNEKSIQREIETIRKLPAAAKTETLSYDKMPVVILRTLLIAGAAFLLIYGFISGGTADVLTKAINICTECIGLG